MNWLMVAAAVVIVVYLVFVSRYFYRHYRALMADPEAKEQAVIEALRRETEKQKMARLRKVRRTAKKLRKTIINDLARQGHSWKWDNAIIPKNKSMKPVIKNILYTSDAIYYRMDALPFRVKFSDLLAPENEVEKNLAIALGREVKLVESIPHGLWVMIGLATGVAAVPKFFAWYAKDDQVNARELLDKLPESKRMAVALGAAENKRFVYQDTRDFPHLLVAGSTGGGKSVWLKQMIATLISRNRPDQLKFLLIDLKGGLEFWRFRSIKHLWKPVVIDRAGVPDVLQELINEKERRFSLLRNADMTDIRMWNAGRSDKLDYIIVVFDEIASLMLDRELKRHVDSLVQNLAEQGRALGIHLILCTQIPKREVISTTIKGNIPSRLAFLTDNNGSMLILDNGRAAHLPPGGRAIYRHAHQQTELQAPYIDDDQVIDAIEISRNIEKDPEITDMEILSRAYHHPELGRKLIPKKTADALKGISQYRIEKLAKAYQYNADHAKPMVIEMDDLRLILSPPVDKPTGGTLGRRFIQVWGELPNNDQVRELILTGETELHFGTAPELGSDEQGALDALPNVEGIALVPDGVDDGSWRMDHESISENRG
jgi:hypothetical protein